jgi:photosystem II stability/assembly factor-like uncharacterized protein
MTGWRVRVGRFALAACAFALTLAVTIVPSASGAGASKSSPAPKPDSGWHEIGRLVEPTSLHAIAFGDPLHGCAIGEGAEMVVTSDGGRTWESRDSHTRAALHSVAFSGAKHAWAVGDGGVIVATNDGGRTWKGQRSGTSADLYCVEFVDSRHGLASYCDSNDRVRLISTSNGGRTWKLTRRGTNWRQGGLAEADTGLEHRAGDAQHRWRVAGELEDELQYTSDGRHWDLRQPLGLEHVDDVSFVDALHGWVVTNSHAIFATSDGGATWHCQRAGDMYFVEQVTFIDRLHGFAVGVDSGLTSYVCRTVDGGRTWSTQSPGGYGYRVMMTDAIHGFLMGYDPARALAYYTDDGAVSWHPLGPIPLTTADAVGCADATHFWATDNLGLTVVTSDYGRTWTMLDLGIQGHVFCPAPGKIEERSRTISAGKDAHGKQLYRTVGEDAILSTSDGGLTWHKQLTNAKDVTSGIAFPDDTHAWAIGKGDAVMSSTDGGRTWSKKSIGATGSPNGIQFADAMHGWVFTGDGSGFGQFSNLVVLGTTDGGRTWNKQPLPQISLRSSTMTFADATHGWIVGRGGRVYATTTGGFPPGSRVASAPPGAGPAQRAVVARGGCTNPALQR